jgi:hypothetical protein
MEISNASYMQAICMQLMQARELWGHVDGTATSPALSEGSSSSSSDQTAFEKAQRKLYLLPKLYLLRV